MTKYVIAGVKLFCNQQPEKECKKKRKEKKSLQAQIISRQQKWTRNKNYGTTPRNLLPLRAIRSTKAWNCSMCCHLLVNMWNDSCKLTAAFAFLTNRHQKSTDLKVQKSY